MGVNLPTSSRPAQPSPPVGESYNNVVEAGAASTDAVSAEDRGSCGTSTGIGGLTDIDKNEKKKQT